MFGPSRVANQRFQRNLRVVVHGYCVLLLLGVVTCQSLSASSFPGQPGISVQPVIIIDHLKPSASASPAVVMPARPLLRARLLGSPETAKTSVTPQSTSTTSAAPSSVATPPIGTNFVGVGDDRANPLDPNLAAGPNHVVEVTNSALRVTDKAGHNLVSVDPYVLFEDYFSQVPDRYFLTDPWIVYDHFAGRFVVIWITLQWVVDEDGFVSYGPDGDYLIQISDTSDPTLGWKVFRMRSDVDGMVDSDFPADYPKICFDDTNFYVTSNQFSGIADDAVSAVTNNDSLFSGVNKVRVMAKSQFYNTQPTTTHPIVSIEYVDYMDILDADGYETSTIQPCITFGRPGKEYLVSAPWPRYSDSYWLTLYSITGTWPNATKTLPVLKMEGPVIFNSWWFPDDAKQKGDSLPLDVVDDRLQRAVYRDGFVYTCHHVLASPLHTSPFIDTNYYPCAAAIKSINVDTMRKGLDELIGAPGEYCFFPSIAVDPDHNVYVVFNHSSPSTYCEIRYTVKAPSDRTFRASNVLKLGEGNQNSATRWGDYNGMALDPSNGSVWFNAMYPRPDPRNPTEWMGHGTWVGNLPAISSSSTQVTAGFDSTTNTLSIMGDGGDNQFSITYVKNKQSLTIAASSKKTQINGKPSETISGIGATTRINVLSDLGAGNDNATWTAIFGGTWNINLGNGNDNVTISNSTGQALNLNGGAGTDTKVLLLDKFDKSTFTGFP